MRPHGKDIGVGVALSADVFRHATCQLQVSSLHLSWAMGLVGHRPIRFKANIALTIAIAEFPREKYDSASADTGKEIEAPGS